MYRALFWSTVIAAVLGTLTESINGAEPLSVFAPLGSHPYIPANASYAPAPAAYVSIRPGWPSPGWAMTIPPTAYGAPSYVAVSPLAIPGWRMADSPTYFRPGFGYMLPTPVFRSQSFGYLDNYSFGQKNYPTWFESLEPQRATAAGGPWYYPGASTNEPQFRFNW